MTTHYEDARRGQVIHCVSGDAALREILWDLVRFALTDESELLRRVGVHESAWNAKQSHGTDYGRRSQLPSEMCWRE